MREELEFKRGKGWVHKSDGQLYKQRKNEKGELVDDHCALPKRSFYERR